MNTLKATAGDFVTIRAHVLQPMQSGSVLVELDDGRQFNVSASMIYGIDRREIQKNSIVESILPSRQFLKGVVLCIDGADVFVRWSEDSKPEGIPSIENKDTLRLTYIPPAQ